MGKCASEDDASVLLTRAKTLDDRPVLKGKSSPSLENSAFTRPKRQRSRSREVVERSKRGSRVLKGAFLNSLDPTSSEEHQRCCISALSKFDPFSNDSDRPQHPKGSAADLQDFNGSNVFPHASGDKWVVKKKDKSRQVASNSAHLGSYHANPRRFRGALSGRKQIGSSFCRKWEIFAESDSNQKKISDEFDSGKPISPACIVCTKHAKTIQHQKRVRARGKKRFSEEHIHHKGGKIINAGSTDHWKHQRYRKRSKYFDKKCNCHSETVHEDDERNLEQNAAQMLSSRFNPRCVSHSVCRKMSANSANLHSTVSHVDVAGKALGPVRRNGDNAVRRRRHFYEVFRKDVDPYWVLTRRIKVFWPLDQAWYFGLVKDYNPSTGLHNVKYDDHDEEWIDLQTERFKLLLFPSEFKCKFVVGDNYFTVKHGEGANGGSNGDCGANTLESEPIISWLARSIHRVKSSQLNILKRNKKSQSNTESSAEAISDMATQFSEPAVKREEQTSDHKLDYLDKRFCFYYSRRRASNNARKGLENTYVGCCDDSISSITSSRAPIHGTVLECKIPKHGLLVVLSSALVEILSYAHMAGTYCLYNFIQHKECNSIMNVWPSIHIEILIIDSVTGLRFISYFGCLIDAAVLICSITSTFKLSGCCDGAMELPVTSVGFQLSRTQQKSANLLFSLEFFQHHDQSKWTCLDQKLKRLSVLVKKIPLSACTYTTISNFAAKSHLISLAPVFKEVARKGSLVDIIPFNVPQRFRKPAMDVLHRTNSFNSRSVFLLAKESIFFLNWHLKLLMKNGPSKRFHTMPRQSCKENNEKSEGGAFSLPLNSIIPENITSSDSFNIRDQLFLDTTKIHNRQIRQCTELSDIEGRTESVPDQLMDMNVCTEEDSISTCNGMEMNYNEMNSVYPPFVNLSSLSEDTLREGPFSGYKKPRTQVSYSMPHERDGIVPMHQNQEQNEYPCKRVRIENAKGMEASQIGAKHLLPSLACEANILLVEGDRCRRYMGAEVILHYDDQDWKILVKLAGIPQYYYKAHQFMQPGVANRYTHAMMWKGGRDWSLEFNHRSQWVIFREMNEECYNLNTRVGNAKNIPIPGVHLIDDNDIYEDVPFVRSPTYFCQDATEVDLAMDPGHMVYDMDSDDEEWVSNLRQTHVNFKSASKQEFDVMFERVIDILERVSFSQKRDKFTDSEIEIFLHDIGPSDASKSIYEYWQSKRQMKGMPLIRQFRPPLWEWYQRQLNEWEMTMSREKEPLIEKPPMFAFCLKPRGWDVSNKGLKQRSHKKMTVSISQNSNGREQHNLLALGRRSHRLIMGNDRTSDFSTHLHSPTGFSPRNLSTEGIFSRDSPKRLGRTHLQIPRSKSMRIGFHSTIDVDFENPPTAYNHKTRRNSSCRWNADESYGWISNSKDGFQRQASDIEEFRLRDASNAAQHALNMAKLKREKAQWLLHKADLALHKAVVALVTAEAMEASEGNLLSDS